MMAHGSRSTRSSAAMYGPKLGEILNQASALWIARVSGALWASTAMGGEKGFNPAKHVKGRKRHRMTDTLGLVLFVVVCAACIADSDAAEYIFHETEGRLPRLHTVLVDQGYKGWLVEYAKRWFGIVVDIVSRSPSQREFIVQPQRWKIEHR